MDSLHNTEQDFLRLYDELGEPLYRHCYFRVSSRELAEDLTQEAFMRVWDYQASGKTIDNPKAFLYRIAGNLIVDHYRRKKESSLEVLAEDGFDPAGDDATGILAQAEGARALQLLEKLEPQHREVLTLRYVDGMDISGIAEVIGQSENVVSVRIHRATEKLKTLFNHGSH